MTDPQDIPTRVIKFAEFLETSPPDSQEEIEDLAFLNPYYNQPIYTMTEPDIQLHCPSELCGGTRVFGCNTSRRVVGPTKWSTEFVTYFCRNCQHQTEIFALALKQDAEKQRIRFCETRRGTTLRSFRPGESDYPRRLIGNFFLRGRRAENHGLGIGAFAYYRRVVENQKGRIISEMGRVAQRLGGKKETLELFAKASTETQFSKAIDLVKSAIPQSLLIDGSNPLSLLHAALSKGYMRVPRVNV